MNDDLTPSERSELRSRVLAGSERIRPRTRRANAWVAAGTAVAAVAVITGGVVFAATRAPVAAPAPAPSATTTQPATQSPTPTPTSNPAPLPAIAFDGDCSRLMDGAEVDEVLGASAVLRDGSGELLSYATSAALAGGLTCTWVTEGGDFLAVAVLDASVVPPAVTAEYESLTCGSPSGACEMSRVVSGAWVGVSLPPEVPDPWAEMSPEVLAQETARVVRVLDAVAGRLTPDAAVAAPRGPAWWDQPACADVRSAVESALGEPTTEGFPGDSYPSGMTWQALVGAGVIEWCASYTTSDYGSFIAEVYPQPGAGRPDDEALAGDHVQAVEVDGADAAWLAQDPAEPAETYVAAVSGDNRLVVRVVSDDGIERTLAVVAAVLTALNGT